MTELSEYTGADNVMLADVNIFALNQMLEHGLIEKGWFFSFDRAKKRLGVCNHSHKKITMSSILTVGQNYDSIKNTVLHEIAHALVGSGHGHDAVWEAKALELGCNGQRCTGLDSPELIDYAWIGKCYDCGHSVKFHRAPGRVRSCANCSPDRFDANYILEWTHFGQETEIGDHTEKFRNEYYAILRRSGSMAEV